MSLLVIAASTLALSAATAGTLVPTLQPTPVASLSRAAAEDEPVMSAGHNGSDVVFGIDDSIVYTAPKPSIRDVVKPGTVLVHGRWIGERYEGTAYAFKRGCAPAPYRVSGRRVETPGRLDLVLTGAGPVRQGCAVVGYSQASPHARLVFDRLMSD